MTPGPALDTPTSCYKLIRLFSADGRLVPFGHRQGNLLLSAHRLPILARPALVVTRAPATRATSPVRAVWLLRHGHGGGHGIPESIRVGS